MQTENVSDEPDDGETAHIIHVWRELTTQEDHHDSGHRSRPFGRDTPLRRTNHNPQMTVYTSNHRQPRFHPMRRREKPEILKIARISVVQTPFLEYMMGKTEVVDGWYAWLVCAASFLVLVIQGGFRYSMGVFYIMFRNALGGSDSALSLVTSLNYSILCLTCPFVGMLTDKYNERPLAVFGALLATLGLVGSSFATEVYHLYISYSLVAGIGFGLVYNPCISIIGRYFKKYVKTAMGLSVCGNGIGSFVFPPIIKALDDMYGWRGAILLLGGIHAHIIFFCCIYRPVPPKPVVLMCSDQHQRVVALSDVQQREILSSNSGQKQVLSSDADLKEVFPSDAEEKEILTNDAEQKEVLSSDAEQKDVLSIDAEQKDVLSNCAEQKEELSSDAEQKVVLSIDAEQKEVLSIDAEQKEVLSLDAEQKEVLSNCAEQKEELSSDAEQKDVFSSDAGQKVVLSIDAEQKEVLSIDAEQKEVLSSDAEQKDVLSIGAEQKDVLSNGAEQKEVFASDAGQKMVLSDDAEQKEVFSSDAGQKVVFSSDAEWKEVSFNGADWKYISSTDGQWREVLFFDAECEKVLSNDVPQKQVGLKGTKTSASDDMNHMQSLTIDDRKNNIANNMEESLSSLSESKQPEDELQHDTANGYDEARPRNTIRKIISLFRNVRFFCLCLHAMLIHFPTVLVYTHFGTYVLTLGYTKGDVIYLYMAIGISSTICMAFIGFLVERINFDPTILVIGSAVTNGLLTVFLPAFHGLVLMYVYGVIFAMMLSPYYAFCFPMVMDFVPKGQSGTAYGIVGLFCVPSTAFGALLAARLYELTNLYASSFYVAGILFILAGLVMIPATCRCGECSYGVHRQTQQETKQDRAC